MSSLSSAAPVGLATSPPELGRMRDVGAAGVAVVGLAATGLTVWSVRRSQVLVDAHSVAIIRGLIVGGYVALGVYTWRKRPMSRLGPLFVGLGLLYALQSLDASSGPLPYTAGRVVTEVLVLYLVFVFVSFPRDHPRSGAERSFLVWFAALSTALWLVALTLVEKLPPGGPLTDCGHSCPQNALQIADASAALTRGINSVITIVTALGLIWTGVLLTRHARSSSRLRRRAVVPALVGFGVIAASYVVYTLLGQAHHLTHRDLFRTVTAAASLLIPVAFLIGQVRGRSFAAASIGRIAATAGREPVTPRLVQTLIRDAIGDPTAELALVAQGGAGYVDADGAVVELPTDEEHAVIPILRDGQQVAALVYDADAVDDVLLVEGLASTSLMLLDRARLLGEVRASRARAFAAAGEERRRIERDLHDGAQQQLIALQLRLSLVLERIEDPELARALEQVDRDAQTALDQLRTFAHGLYPMVLQLGLGPAMRSAARSAAIPVTVQDGLSRRWPGDIEMAIYFTALEALQNAAKHAGPGASVTINLRDTPDSISFSVADSGAGFELDKTASGVGLLNMQDRIEAASGRFEIISTPGRGTTVYATFPGTSVGVIGGPPPDGRSHT